MGRAQAMLLQKVTTHNEDELDTDLFAREEELEDDETTVVDE